jgi:hypothetical protein
MTISKLRPVRTYILADIWRDKCVEPVKRKYASNGVQWVVHRFPIKDGISLRDAWIRELYRPSPMMQRLLRNAK